MAAPSIAAEQEVHRHRDCGSRERPWLARERRSASTAAPHPYCIDCGTVKDLTLPSARPRGYYLSGIAHLQEYLARSAAHGKLAQVQSHLIAQRLAARPEFEDPYGTPGQAQLEAYVEIVRSVRPDLEEEDILRMTPGRRRPTFAGTSETRPKRP